MSDELWRWDAVRMAQAIQTRVVSSKEVVAACLARLESVNPRMNAVVESLAAEALALAERADGELASRICTIAKVDRADEAYFREKIAPLLSDPGVEFIGEINERSKTEFGWVRSWHSKDRQPAAGGSAY
jgi:hypothetical protein